MSRVGRSSFHALQHAAREAERLGRDVLYLSVGEPGFETPFHVKEAAIRAIHEGQTRYTATDGTPSFKAAIQRKFRRDNQLIYATNEITVAMGGVQAIFNTFMATIGPGDEVILPAPFFSPYLSSVSLTGAEPIVLMTREEDGFVPRAKDIAALLTPRTRWLVLNSPANPSGAIIGEQELREIAAVLQDHPRALVFSDDIYEAIRLDDQPFKNIVNVVPSFRDRTVILNGVSKSYAMTGWRMAYLAGPAPLIESITELANSSAFAPNSISQIAATEALDGPQHLIRDHNEAYRQKRDLLLKLLDEIPQLSYVRPSGTFFLLVNWQQFLGVTTRSGHLLANDVDFVLHLLREANIAFMPGSAFGLPGYFRISFAVAGTTLREAIGRLAAACADLAATSIRRPPLINEAVK